MHHLYDNFETFFVSENHEGANSQSVFTKIQANTLLSLRHAAWPMVFWEEDLRFLYSS